MKPLQLRNCVLGAFLILAMVRCGKEDPLQSGVKVHVSPSRPIVILDDFTFDSDPSDPDNELTTYKAPWTRVVIDVLNTNAETITVFSIPFTATAQSKTGGTVTSSGAFDAGDISPPPDPPEFVLAELTTNATYTQGIFFHGLPESAVGPSYNFEASIRGWVGTENSPEKSFEKFFSFYANP